MDSLLLLLLLVAAAAAIPLPSGEQDTPQSFMHKCPVLLQAGQGDQFEVPTGDYLMKFMMKSKGVSDPSQVSSFAAYKPDTGSSIRTAPGSGSNIRQLPVLDAFPIKTVINAKTPKCQQPRNLQYCTEVNWPVPFYGWIEWAHYLENCVKHYIEHTYKAEETSPECISAAKQVMCASYFPKCSGHKDKFGEEQLWKPCAALCTRWRDELQCPGTSKVACRWDNKDSISFGQNPKECTGNVPYLLSNKQPPLPAIAPSPSPSPLPPLASNTKGSNATQLADIPTEQSSAQLAAVEAHTLPHAGTAIAETVQAQEKVAEAGSAACEQGKVAMSKLRMEGKQCGEACIVSELLSQHGEALQKVGMQQQSCASLQYTQFVQSSNQVQPLLGEFEMQIFEKP